MEELKYFRLNPEFKNINTECILNPDKLTDDIRCLLCNKLSIDPLFCGKCKKVSCSNCLNHNLCSVCSSQVQTSLPDKIHISLSGIKVRCYFHKEGCEDIIDYNHFDYHVRNCFFNSYKCKGCNYISKVNTMENHLKICENKEYCCLICYQNIKRRELATHNDGQCLETIEMLIKPSKSYILLGENYKFKLKIDELGKELQKLQVQLKKEYEFRQNLENIDEESKADLKSLYDSEWKNEILDFIQEDDYKVIDKDPKLTDNQTNEILNLVKNSKEKTKSIKESCRYIKDRLDTLYGRNWTVISGFSYNYAVTFKNKQFIHIRGNSLYFTIFRSSLDELNPEETVEVLNKDKSLTMEQENQIKNIVKQELMETNKNLFTRCKNVKERLDILYGAKWCVLCYSYGDSFFEYYNQEYINLKYMGLYIIIFRSCITNDGFNLESKYLDIIAKDSNIDKEFESLTIKLVKELRMEYPDDIVKRGEELKKSLEKIYGLFFTVIVGGSYEAKLTYFDEKYIKIKYSGLTYIIFKSK